MKRFVDLNLRVPQQDATQTKQMIRKAKTLGYSKVAVPLPSNASKQQISQLKQACVEAELDFVSRTDISPRNSNELLNELRRCRRKFEIVAVRCNTKDVARKAAKDRRVDLLLFSATNPSKRFFDEQEAELASQALSALEIELASLLQLTSFSRIRILSCLRKEMETAKRAKVPVILSSGATKQSLMRGPYDYAALTTIFDFPLPEALKALSETPLELIEQNRKKLSPDFVAPGIRVVRKGKR